MDSEELYTRHFGLKERPFTLLPDPSFLFWSSQHKRAFMILEFGLMSRAPITLITGEIGSGKTTLLQKLLGQMDESVKVGLISNAQGGRGELLQWILNALSVPVDPAESYVTMFQKFQDFMVQEYAEGRRVVLIIDEAQNLSSEGLEELRMLTNINANKDELIQLILVGQPELKRMVLSPKMRQLAQRVTASFHLDSMNAPTVRHYIAHRLKVAGGTGKEFTPGACKEIFQATHGVPRLINQLCEFSMLYAWSNNASKVTKLTVDNVLKDGVFFGEQLFADEPEDPLFLSQRDRVYSSGESTR